MSKHRSPGRGFTLVELLVVMAIIAVLVAIVLPVVHGARLRARQTSCMANLGEIALALKVYQQDYRGYPLGAVMGNQPGLIDDAGAGPGAANYNTVHPTNGTRSRISGLFANYLEDQKRLICPDEDGTITGLASTSLNGQPTADVLKVGGDGSGSTYDEFYNTFGYAADGTPQLNLAALTRQTKALVNRYAPGDTIVTFCREHERHYGDPSSAVNLVVRVGGGTDKVVRANYDFSAQAETVYD